MKRMFKRSGLVVGSAGAACALAMMPASAETAQPTVSFAGGVIQASGGAVALKISYTCTSTTPGSMNHLFAALKQGPGVSPSNSSTESRDVQTFYSTNWHSDAGPNALTCNGQPQHQTVVLKLDPYYDSPSPRFQSGDALVQLCLFDNVTQFSETGEPANGGFAPSYTMQKVHAANR